MNDFVEQLTKLKKPWDESRFSTYQFIQTPLAAEKPSRLYEEPRLPDWQFNQDLFDKRTGKAQPLAELIEKFVYAPDSNIFSSTYENLLHLNQNQTSNLLELLHSYLLFQNEDFRKLLIWLIQNSPDCYIVNLCLKILSRYKNKDDRKLFFEFGAHNYFRETAMKYVLHSDFEVEDGLWRLAMYPYSCTRTHIVPNLPPSPKQEIKDWLLREAPNHDLLVEFALDCVEKGDLKSALSKETIDPALLAGAKRLMVHLISGVAGGNLNTYEFGPESTLLFVKHLSKSKINFEDLETFTEVRHFVEKMLRSEETRERWLTASKEIISICTAILSAEAK